MLPYLSDNIYQSNILQSNRRKFKQETDNTSAIYIISVFLLHLFAKS